MILNSINKFTLKNQIYARFNLAKENIQKRLVKASRDSAISDRIPNYCAKDLDFSAYKKDSFVALFVDVRNSSKRLNAIGLDNTFLTMHAMIPPMIYITEAYGGYIIDIPGDGIMVLFKDNPKHIYWKKNGKMASDEIIAVDCAHDILEVHKNIVNPLLEENSIPSVDIGIGLDTGEVIVTKIGTEKNYDTKAIGNCINNASKNSSGFNKIIISKSLFDMIPEYSEKFDNTSNPNCLEFNS
jgi:class 3 adenylate cyclase